jgi:primosomal protein N'
MSSGIGGPIIDTTPTGIPIINCPICGFQHPASRAHCPRCGLAHLYECPKGGRQ